jgi:hypothetical protein
MAVSAQSLGTGKSIELAQEEFARDQAGSVKILAVSDAGYPRRLREIYDPPLVLYVRGNLEALAQPGIAMVGTRHPTPYGTGMAERLSCDLCARGLVIISGMARGVDTASHRGAISAKGKTIAVFGTGIDVSFDDQDASRHSTNDSIANGKVLRCRERPDRELGDERSTERQNLFGQAGVFFGVDHGIQRDSHYSALRLGTESRRVCGARERDQQELVGAPDQAGRQAGRDVGGRLGRTPYGCEAYADSSHSR